MKLLSTISNKIRIIHLRLKGCIVGRDCKIGKNVTVVGFKKIELGDNVTIEENVKLKVMNYSNLKGERNLIIGNNVFIGYGTVIDVNMKVQIGSNCMFGPYCFITDSNHKHNSNDTPFAGLGGIYKKTTIESNCWITSHCIILPGVTIGKNSIVAANSVVNKNINQNTLNAGSPAIQKNK